MSLDAQAHRDQLLLARGVETWRGIALKYIDVALELHVRSLAAQRALSAQLAANAALRETVERLGDQLAEAREEIACRSGVVK